MNLDWQLFEQAMRLLEPLLVVLPRILMALSVLPLLPQNSVPPMIRVGIALSLSLALHPMGQVHVAAVHGAIAWMLLVAKEAFIGWLIGYAMGSVVWAFEGMGALVDNQTGMSNAQTFDPFGGHDGGPHAPLMAHFAIYLLMAGGGFSVLVSLLCQSYAIWPVHAPWPQLGPGFVQFAGGHVQSMLDLTVKLAAPVIMVLVVVELGMGLINRVAQQFNVFYFSMPIKAATAALVLALGLAHLIDLARSDVSEWPARLDDMGRSAGGLAVPATKGP